MENYYNQPDFNENIYNLRDEYNDVFPLTEKSDTIRTLVFCFIFGVAFANLFLFGGFGISVPILTVAFYAFAIPYLCKKQSVAKLKDYVLLLPIAALSVGIFWHDNRGVHFITLLVLLVLVAIQLCKMSNIGAQNTFSTSSFCMAISSVFAFPFKYFDMPFKTLKNLFSNKTTKSKWGMLLLGLLIAIPFAAIFISLFSRADAAFSQFCDSFFDKVNFFDGDFIPSVIIGSFFFLYIFSLLITLRGRKEAKEKNINFDGFINGFMVSTVLAVINAVSVLFSVVQFKYLFAGGTLPDGMNHAEYARTGFFELCTAIAFSVSIIFFCILCVKKVNSKLPVGIKVMLSIFIGCNFIMIASAFYRMLNYIKVYDLTVKRFLVTWLIIIFAVCMLGALIKLWCIKYRITKHIAITVIAMTILLNFVNINSSVAYYNVNKHIENISNGEESNLDVYYLERLGTGATQATYRLLYKGGKETRYLAKELLIMQGENLEQKEFERYCLTDFTAKKYLKDFS